jgi:HPt (histidine-containing phosphotransfer) domain-containing protein
MKAAAGSELPEYARLAHSLKGSSLNIGAQLAGETASQLEAAAKGGDRGLVEAKHKEFVSVMEKLFGEIKGFLGLPADGDGAAAEAKADAGDGAGGDGAKGGGGDGKGDGSGGNGEGAALKAEDEAKGGSGGDGKGGLQGAAEAPAAPSSQGGNGSSETASKGNSGGEPSAVDGGFDSEASLAQLGGDPELLTEVLDLYIESTPDILAKLKDVSADSLAEYARNAHSIKGSSLNIGAEKVGGMAAKMEKAAKEGDLKTVQEGNQLFIDTANSLISQMKDYTQKIRGE